LPLVTIGVPVFNGERFLSEAVESALAQDYPAIRVVIADNASTDATPEIAAALAARDHRVTVVRHPRNIGAIPNFNGLIDHATGPYFKWLAADDRIEPGFVRECIRTLEADPSAVLCSTAWHEIDERGAAIRQRVEHLSLTGTSAGQRIGRLICANEGNSLIYGVIRVDALRRTGRLADYYGSERALLAELALMGPIVELAYVLWAGREHPARSTHVRFDANWSPDLGLRSALVHPAIALTLVRIIVRSPIGWRVRGDASVRLLYCILRRARRLAPALVLQFRHAARAAARRRRPG
jgi:glycosyltransferase involved in cell wall biosynthesis